MLPFIRQFPNGRRGLSEVTCFSEVEQLGRQFIAHGGAYVCEILPDGMARIAACLEGADGSQEDVESEIVLNGVELSAAVDRLVRASVKHVAP